MSNPAAVSVPVMLHKVEKSPVLFGNGQIKNMSRALTKMAMQCRDVFHDKPLKIGSTRAVKPCPKSK